jgi:hypothetical protein
VVVLQRGFDLPEGTRVVVRPVKAPAAKKPARPQGRRKLLRHAGKASDLPADSARNLDHYLYGHPNSPLK